MATPPTGNPEGRPTKYQPRYCQELIDDMAQGYSLGAFAGKIGVARATLANWASEHPEFLAAVETGKAKRLRQWETALIDNAMTGGASNPGSIQFGVKNAGREDWVEQKEIVHWQQHDYSALRNEELLTVIELLAKVEGGIPPSSSEPSRLFGVLQSKRLEKEREEIRWARPPLPNRASLRPVGVTVTPLVTPKTRTVTPVTCVTPQNQ